jgi:hypothetical protein
MSRAALLLIFATTLPTLAQAPVTVQFGLGLVPSTKSFPFLNHNYGPKSEEFNPKTQVWTVRFRSDGTDHPHATSTPPDELLINFYGWNPATDPRDYADRFVAPRPNLKLLGKFQAADPVTQATAFFIVSETVYPGEPDAFLDVTKITSIEGGAYAITFQHFVPGDNAEQRGKDWYLSPEGQAAASAAGKIAVDPSWRQHLVWPDGK